MSLNSQYVTAPNFQQFFVDKNGLPLANGSIDFFSDINRTDRKAVYTIAGSQANYNYIQLPNPLTLSAAGTVVDDQGFPVVIYWKPVNEQFPSEQELYYVVLKDQYGAVQQIVQAWPNPNEGAIPGGSDSSKNYIPNGQFLAHTDLPDNLLVVGSNVVAQGGFTMEMGLSLFSTNTFLFQQITGSPSGYSNSPRYKAIFNSSANLSDPNKAFRIKWRDVNKFSSETTNIYTYGFWAKSSVTTPVNINLIKNFGTSGSPETEELIAPVSIGTDLNFYEITVDFGNNDGTFVGTSNDDFVAIDISFPVDISFVIEMSDFALLKGDVAIENFPLQTDADMLSEGVAGWMPIPNPDGSDLFCPLTLTREGMTFDKSSIGKIMMASGTVLSPNDPLAYTNDMPMDGTVYKRADFSALGIPYSRLGNYLHAASSVGAYPIYGTGADYVTGWTNYGLDDRFYIYVNSPGTPIATAADGTTGFTFNKVVTYGGTQVGRVTLGLQGSWCGTSQYQAIAPIGTTLSGLSTTGLPGYLFALQDSNTGLYAGTGINAIIATATPANTFVLTAGVCAHIDFTSSVIGTVRVYYRVDGLGTTPVFSANDIILDVESTSQSVQIAQLTASALNGLQITQIITPAIPTSGEYFTFQANPGALRNFTVLYSNSSNPSNPVPGTELVIVPLAGLTTFSALTTATYLAINSYQYYIPDFSGLFARGYDPSGVWDEDYLLRVGFGLLGGPHFGTYEYAQFESHSHAFTNTAVTSLLGLDPASLSRAATGADIAYAGTGIATSGGFETRPVNFYGQWVIKY